MVKKEGKNLFSADLWQVRLVLQGPIEQSSGVLSQHNHIFASWLTVQIPKSLCDSSSAPHLGPHSPRHRGAAAPSWHRWTPCGWACCHGPRRRSWRPCWQGGGSAWCRWPRRLRAWTPLRGSGGQKKKRISFTADYVQNVLTRKQNWVTLWSLVAFNLSFDCGSADHFIVLDKTKLH